MNIRFSIDAAQNTNKPDHVVTSIKQSPVSKGILFFLSCHLKFNLNSFSFKMSPVLQYNFSDCQNATSIKVIK